VRPKHLSGAGVEFGLIFDANEWAPGLLRKFMELEHQSINHRAGAL
jgi:hypothetical protein